MLMQEMVHNSDPTIATEAQSILLVFSQNLGSNRPNSTTNCMQAQCKVQTSKEDFSETTSAMRIIGDQTPRFTHPQRHTSTYPGYLFSREFECRASGGQTPSSVHHGDSQKDIRDVCSVKYTLAFKILGTISAVNDGDQTPRFTHHNGTHPHIRDLCSVKYCRAIDDQTPSSIHHGDSQKDIRDVGSVKYLVLNHHGQTATHSMQGLNVSQYARPRFGKLRFVLRMQTKRPGNKDIGNIMPRTLPESVIEISVRYECSLISRMARAAKKAKRRKSDTLHHSNLSNAKLAASEALVHMLQHKTAQAAMRMEEVSVDTAHEAGEELAEHSCLSIAADVDEESAIGQEHQAQYTDLLPSSSEDEDDVSEKDNEGTSMRATVDSFSCEPTAGLRDQTSFGVIHPGRRLRKLRLPSPMPNSPSPSPDGPMPSFYETLWLAVEKNRH
ncbi:hypothetical protein C8R45DRAFT_947150 [Mycena sanguinolenta]|nr:hypothetical protein C8R45DRAFT_947150 [Mycena sanguinolenta]